jgi:hypothetical protein
MPEPGETCSKCEFWLPHPSPEGDGECRRHAPHPQEREAPAKWPRTLSADWCGEYKRKRKPAT